MSRLSSPRSRAPSARITANHFPNHPAKRTDGLPGPSYFSFASTVKPWMNFGALPDVSIQLPALPVTPIITVHDMCQQRDSRSMAHK